MSVALCLGVAERFRIESAAVVSVIIVTVMLVKNFPLRFLRLQP